MRLSYDSKNIYCFKSKVATIDHTDKVIRGLGFFSSDISMQIKDFASSLGYRFVR